MPRPNNEPQLDHARIRKLLIELPELSLQAIACRVGCSPSMVSRIRNEIPGLEPKRKSRRTDLAERVCVNEHA